MADEGPLVWVSPCHLNQMTAATWKAAFCSRWRVAVQVEEVSAFALRPRGPSSLCSLSVSILRGCRPTGASLSGPCLGLFRTCLCAVNMEELLVHVEKCHFTFINERKYFYCLC